MKKKMFVYAAVAALAASSVAFAERAHGNAQETQLATKAASSANSAQEFLFRNFVTYQGMLLAQTDQDGPRSAVILAVNVAHMWTLTPEQQVTVRRDVLQLDKFQPGSGPWDAVRTAPSRVKALLSVTASQNQEIAKIDGGMGSTFLDIANSNRSLSDKFKAHWANEEAGAKKVRAVLNADQRREFDSIRLAGIKLMNEALTSRKP